MSKESQDELAAAALLSKFLRETNVLRAQQHPITQIEVDDRRQRVEMFKRDHPNLSPKTSQELDACVRGLEEALQRQQR
jgi:hypothetical protein